MPWLTTWPRLQADLAKVLGNVLAKSVARALVKAVAKRWPKVLAEAWLASPHQSDTHTDLNNIQVDVFQPKKEFIEVKQPRDPGFLTQASRTSRSSGPAGRWPPLDIGQPPGPRP